MLIKSIDTEICKSGDIIAADVLNELGVALVAKDTVMNEYIREKLLVYGIRKIKIYQKSEDINEDFQKCYTDILLQTQRLFREIVAGKPLDCESVAYIAEEICNSIIENDRVIRCLNCIHRADEYTYKHSVNVAFYSMLIAKWLHFSDRRIKLAVKSGLLHDIGKVRIPNEILNKKGKLTREEFEIIKEHTILGYEIVKDLKEIENDVKSAVLLHHERIDGSGYPYHFYSDNVNLFARIVAVADVFDAMTSDRVYKGKATPFDVFEMFQTVGIGIFDTQILNSFTSKLSTYLVGAKVLLNCGRTGEIAYIPQQDLINPIVKVESEYIDLAKSEETKIISMLQAEINDK